MLKWLALLFMTIDHIGYYFVDSLPPLVYLLLRMIGRLAFPIFAYYIVKGFTRSRSPFHYLFRISCWAVIAHFAISAASYFAGYQTSFWSLEWTNVLVLFAFAIIMLLGCDLAMRSYHDMIASMTPASDSPFQLKEPRYDVKVNLGGITMSPQVGMAVGIVMVLTSFWAVTVLRADYGIYGLLTVLFIHVSYKKDDECVSAMLLFLLFLILNVGNTVFALATFSGADSAILQSISMFSVLFIQLLGKDRKKPGRFAKYFFYAYYPLHVVLLILLSRYWEQIIFFLHP